MPDVIESELERIVRSKSFSASPRLVRFLRYCVENSREGSKGSLKESVIGVQVFDRLPSYDPKADPIVRVHARRLRQKLEAFYDSADCSSVIIRIPKGGYVAEFEEPIVKRIEESIRKETSSALQEAGSGSSPVVRPGIAAAALAILALTLMFLWNSTRRDPVAPGVQPLVSLPGSAKEPAWAPDGKTIAFSWDGGTQQDPHAYIIRNGESVPSRLTQSTEPEYRPVWSPDGKSIALLRETRAQHFTLVVVNLEDKTEHVLRQVVQLSPALFAPALDWSSDGRWLVTSEQPSEGPEPVHLVLVSPATGRSWVITDPPDGSTGDLEARFSPDSRQILFRRGGNGDLFMLSLTGSTASVPVAITTQNPGVRGLAFSPDGKTIYFGSREGSSRFGIWCIRHGESTPIRVTPANIDAVEPAVNKSGRLLAFAQPMVDVNLWLYSLRQPETRRLLVPSTQAEYSPAFSPDGKQLAFISDRSGSAEIWTAGLAGGQPHQLTEIRNGALPMWPSWSPDGTKITYFCRSKGWNYAYQIDVTTGARKQLTAGENYALLPQYSRDGQHLYYVSNAENRFRIWSQSLASGAMAEPLTADSVRYFRVSKDRRSLYFLRGYPEQLIRMDLATREEQTLWILRESPAGFDTWDVAGNHLFYVHEQPAHFDSFLTEVDFTSGETRQLGAVGMLSREWQTGITASPNGETVIVPQVDTDSSKLMLLHVGQ